MVNAAMICLIGLTILYRIETWVAYGGGITFLLIFALAGYLIVYLFRPLDLKEWERKKEEKERRRYEAEKKTSQNISAKGLSSGPEKNTGSRVDQTVDQPAGKSVTYQPSATPAWSLASACYAWLDDADDDIDEDDDRDADEDKDSGSCRPRYRDIDSDEYDEEDEEYEECNKEVCDKEYDDEYDDEDEDGYDGEYRKSDKEAELDDLWSEHINNEILDLPDYTGF